jgi:activator of HSP90 ATPase
MSDLQNAIAAAKTSTRRQVISGAALTLGALAASSTLWGKPQQGAKEAPSAGTDQTRTSLHQEIDFKVGPQRLYEALLDAKQFSAFSGAPAEIDRGAGGAFSMFGGIIVGRNIELVPNQRIVQAWRPKYWRAGVYSIVKFELKEQGSRTKVILDHTGFPEGLFASLDSGWYERYWEPLKKFFA